MRSVRREEGKRAVRDDHFSRHEFDGESGQDAEPSEVEPPWVEAREAAEMLGVSQRSVRNLIAGGKLETAGNGGSVPTRLLVSTASVKRLCSERPRSERA